MSASDTTPIVTEVLRFEDLPLGSRGTRRAIARWSDGSESEALTWYADEILICEGDLIGKTRDELRSVHFAGTATGFSPDRRPPAERADPPPEGGTPWRACGWRGIGPPAGRATTHGRA